MPTTGIRILAGVDFKNNRVNALIVAIGMIALIAPTSSRGCCTTCIL